MTKKMIGILGIIAVIIVVAGVYILIAKHNSTQNETGDTGSFKNTSMTINGYTISINSKEAGHPSRGSYFNTSFVIIGNDHSTSSYDVDFIDLKLTSESTGNDGIIYDIARPEEITINGKKFNYYIDESNWNATLYYQIPDKNGQLIIKVSGKDVFDSKGNQLKTLAFVDKKVLESNELAGILNFSINK